MVSSLVTGGADCESSVFRDIEIMKNQPRGWRAAMDGPER